MKRLDVSKKFSRIFVHFRNHKILIGLINLRTQEYLECTSMLTNLQKNLEELEEKRSLKRKRARPDQDEENNVYIKRQSYEKKENFRMTMLK